MLETRTTRPFLLGVPALALLATLAGCEATGGVGGVSLESAPGFVDLGILPLGTQAEFAFVVTNVGGRDAVLESLDLELVGAQLQALPSSTLPSDESITLSGSYTPVDEGFFAAPLDLTWSDLGVAHHLLLGLHALVEQPIAQPDRTRVDFGPVDWLADPSESLALRSLGVAGAIVTDVYVTDSSGTFSVALPTVLDSLPAAVPGGEVAVLELHAQPGPGSGTPPPVAATLTVEFEIGAPVEVTLIANDCPDSSSGRWDSDGDGYTICGGDCDDTRSNVNPGAIDINDGVPPGQGLDNDCNGTVNDDALSYDDDGDGFCENPAICTDGSTPGDCHDQNASAYPGATEVVDGVDNDCDGLVDEDSDRSDDDGDGVSEREGDCDDADSLRFPGKLEVANGIDDNCDLRIDEGVWFTDEDGDHYPEDEGDCDDSDRALHPSQAEDCSDGIDNDCDTLIDATDVEACFTVRALSIGGGACSTGGPTNSAPSALVLALLLLGLLRRRGASG